MKFVSTAVCLLSLVKPTSAANTIPHGKQLRGRQSKPVRSIEPDVLAVDLSSRTLQKSSPDSSSTPKNEKSSGSGTAVKSVKSSSSGSPVKSVKSTSESIPKQPTEKSVKTVDTTAKQPTEKSQKQNEKSMKNKNNCKSAKKFGNLLNFGCVGRDDEYVTKENTPVLIVDLLENDNRVQGSNLEIVSITQPSNGILNEESGGYLYTPIFGFIGVDTFEYTVVDGLGGSHIATVFVTVEPENGLPNAGDDIFTLLEGTELRLGPNDILGNDIDPDGDELMIESCTDPSSGWAKVKGDGSITYSPSDGFVGTDSIVCTIIDDKGGVDTSTITFIVNAQNTDPFARDDIYVIDMGSPLELPAPGILSNDVGVESGLLSVVDCAEATRGTLTFDSSGAITYTPVNFFIGVINVECELDNGQGGADISRLIIAVRPPFFGGDLETDEDVPLTLVPSDILDPGSIGSVVAGCSDATFGAMVQNDDGTFTYTPQANFNGEDSVECTVTRLDGVVETKVVVIIVRPVGDQPIAFPDSYSVTMNNAITYNPVENDVDVDGDSLEIFFFTQPNNGQVASNGDGTLTYTPNAGFTGTDIHEYTVSDGEGGLSSTTITIIVNMPTDVNTRPVAVNDDYDAIENTMLTIGALSGLLANDFDEDGNFLTVTSFTQPIFGSLTLSQDGSFSYVPQTNFVGVDVFDYIIFDGTDINTATVTIVVSAGTSGPVVANGDFYSTTQNTPLQVQSPGIFENDENVVRLIEFTDPETGSVIQGPDGSFIYIPKDNWIGVDSYKYTVVDSSGNSASATVTISVTFGSLPPLIIPGGDIIDLSGGNSTKRVSSDCKGLGFTNCTGVDTVEKEEERNGVIGVNFGK